MHFLSCVVAFKLSVCDCLIMKPWLEMQFFLELATCSCLNCTNKYPSTAEVSLLSYLHPPT